MGDPRGARVGVAATGDPYGIRWRPADGALRDQAAGWCGRPIARIAVLPPGERLGAGAPDENGVWWTTGSDPAFAGWCVGGR